MSLVAVRDVSFSYGNDLILENIGFRVENSQVFCLLGPNGCGKTTLLDCILGTLRIKTGRISVNGTTTNGLTPRMLAKLISYVPQGHERTFPYRVLEVVMMGRAAYTGMFSAPNLADREIAEAALKTVGIFHLRKRAYTRLSGGEGQLVLIARALTQDSPVIVMDEPTAHLDFRNELVVLETIARLVKEKGISVIMATHFPNHAFFFENDDVPVTVAMLKGGRFVETGLPGEVLQEPQIKKLYAIEAGVVSYDRGVDKPGKQVIPLRSCSLNSRVPD